MDGYGPDTYGNHVADVYDNWFVQDQSTEDCVNLLAELAGRGPVLELAVGTGRVAVPLAHRGFEVHGIDASEAMLARLRAKPGGDAVHLSVGDIADGLGEGSFSLAFVLFNSFFLLRTQDEQVQCFQQVAERLAPGGCFVLECFVPDMRLFDRDQRVSTETVGVDRVRFNVTRHFPSQQRVDTQHIVLGQDGIRLFPVSIRYAWPSELDLMARMAGLRLRDRWADWRRGPFDDASGLHVSVYEK